MSPRTGRPPKGNMTKNVSLQLRISDDTANKLQDCANVLGISRTEVIEQGIEIIHKQVEEKK